jgi:DNA processing protein
MSVYGKNCAYNISKELAQKGAVIVSGLADGVDSMAHSGALDAGMPTVAIIGCGVNVVYPKKNAALMKRILEHGMVISEYPLCTNPEKYHFPERNRIIAALSPATLVIEANIKSGSLITAKLSCDLGKDVYAVPGSIYSAYSKGTNYLIKDGAYPVSCADDVFTPYKETYAEYIRAGMNDKKEHIIENKMSPNEFISIKLVDEESYADKDERKILSILSDTPVSMDFIYESLDMDISVLNTKLLMMELCGRIKKNPGNTYSKI